jgi:hypothetical protein
MIADYDPYETVEIDLLPLQYEQLVCTDKWAASRGGNGSGKTTAWVWWTIVERMMKYPAASIVVVGATYSQLDQGFFSTLQDVLVEHFGLEQNNGYVYRRGVGGQPQLMLFNGAKIRGWSAEMALRAKSANIQTLIIEEPQTWGPRAEAAFEAISTRLRPNERTGRLYPDLLPMGRISFNPTNVGPGHWLYNLLERRWPKYGWRTWRMSSRDNYLLARLDPTYVANLEVGMAPQRWDVEIEGHYQTSGGDVYRNFDDTINCGEPAQYGLPPFALYPMPIAWAHDFNIHMQCSTISQAHVQTPIVEYVEGRMIRRMPVSQAQRRVFYTLGELVLEQAGSEDVVRAFLAGQWGEHAKKYGVVLYGDETGGHRSSSVSTANPITSNWLAIIHGLEAAGIQRSIFPNGKRGNGLLQVRIQKKNPPVMDRINAVNAQFHTSGGTGGRSPGRNGIGAFFDRLTCTELLTDFRLVKLVDGKNELDQKSDKRRTHMSDAYGYMVWYERAREIEQERKTTWSIGR